jgi:hypothetical protein
LFGHAEVARAVGDEATYFDEALAIEENFQALSSGKFGRFVLPLDPLLASSPFGQAIQFFEALERPRLLVGHRRRE